MWTIERVNVAAVLDFGPAARLYGAGAFQGQFVEIPLPLIGWEAALIQQAEQITVGRDVVEAMVVDAEMADVRRHFCDRIAPAAFQ